VDGPNSSKNPEFRNDLKTINEQPTASLDASALALEKKSASGKVVDPALTTTGAVFHLEQEMELACVATGATGAAIALVRGDKIVCHATAGPDAPDVGVYLDPHSGLSGSCIQTRQVQQCDDTETDPRVDPEASRTLGVRSIVVLPLIEGDKLFGIFEVLSIRPYAFGPTDLETLQALTNRIVRMRSQSWEYTAAPTPSPKVTESLAGNTDVAIQKPGSESKGTLPFPQQQVPLQMSQRSDLIVAALGVLVIAAALLLGTLVGWRLGWQRATLALGTRSPRHSSIAIPKTRESAGTASAATDECGESLAASPGTEPPSSGLTVCQEGKVIFRLPASATVPTKDLAPVAQSR
jgi:hypothetical protein